MKYTTRETSQYKGSDIFFCQKIRKNNNKVATFKSVQNSLTYRHLSLPIYFKNKDYPQKR